MECGLCCLQGYDAASGYGEGGSPQPPGPSKVYVLMGGEGAQRQNSLKSGQHIWLMLQNNPELQVRTDQEEEGKWTISG